MMATGLQKASEKPKTRAPKNMFQSEQFLSKFGLEYIKHDILIDDCKLKKKKTVTKRKKEALFRLAHIFHLKKNEKYMTKKCNKFRHAFQLMLQHLVRRCLNQRWALDFALLLAPPWVRAVEMKIKLMSHAINMERKELMSPERLQAAGFKTLLVENATAAVAAGNSLYGPEAVANVISQYGSYKEPLVLWRGLCNNVKSLIALEAECREGSHEADCRVADLILLYDDSISIVTPACLSQPKQLQKLTYLYETIVKRDVEDVLRNKGPNLLLAWMQVFGVYQFSNGFASLVYIQRQWHELKHLARCQVLEHRRSNSIQPHQLLQAIVDKYKYIVQEPFPKWTDLVESKLVVELKSIDKKVYEKVLEDSVDELKKAMESAEIVRKSSRRQRGSSVPYLIEDVMDYRVTGDTSDTLSVNSEKYTEDVSTSSSEDDSVNDIADTVDARTDAELIDKTDTTVNVTDDKCEESEKLEMFKEDNNNMKEIKNIEMELRYIDPTKAKKCLIFDSDTDESTDELSKSSCANSNGAHGVMADRHSDQTKVLTSKTNTEGTDDILKKQVAQGNTNMNDPKLAKTIIVPLVRCDNTPAWKKCFSNNSINIKKISSKQRCLTKVAYKLRRHGAGSDNSSRSGSHLNINLDGSSENVLRNINNKHLLALCRPLSVNLEQMKFTNVERFIIRRAKKIQLPDIEEVRKINSTILTAEVAPVSLTRCAPASEDMNETRSAENATREISNFDVDNKIETQSPHLINMDKPTESTEDQNSSCTGPVCGTEHCNKEMEQKEQEPKSNDVDQKCNPEDAKLTDQDLNIVSNCPGANNSADIDDSIIRENNPNTEMSSDNEDDLKLSVVMNKINEKSKNISRKRQNEQENNLAPSRPSQAKKRKKNKPDTKLSEPRAASSDDYEEWSRQKNMMREYFQLPSVSAKRSAQANGQNYNPFAPSPCGAVTQNVVIVTNSQYKITSCTINTKNSTPLSLYKNTNAHNVSVSDNNDVIDLTDAAGDQEVEEEGNINNEENFSPIITNVYSLAVDQPRHEADVQDPRDTASTNHKEQQNAQVVQPISPQMNIDTCKSVDQLATVVPSLNVPGAAIVPNAVPQLNIIVPSTPPGQHLALPFFSTDGDLTLQPTLCNQPSATWTWQPSGGAVPPLVPISADTANAGRRFVIIPKSQLVSGQNSLVMPNLRIVNASLTYNPVDHIQKMMVPMEAQVSPSLTPLEKGIESAQARPTTKTFTLLSHWVQGKLEHELIILQVDNSKPPWTVSGGNIVTSTDYTCEKPIYCALGPNKSRTRILFPLEQNSNVVYNPTTVRIYENAANGDSPFANWVKSVLKNDKTTNLIRENNTDNDGRGCTEPTKDPLGLDNEAGTRKDEKGQENAKPIARIKVKSFARLTEDQKDDFDAPSRVSLQGMLYMKVSDQPLKYAKVLTVVPSSEEVQRLLSMDEPLWFLPEGTTTLDTLQPVATAELSDTDV